MNYKTALTLGTALVAGSAEAKNCEFNYSLHAANEQRHPAGMTPFEDPVAQVRARLKCHGLDIAGFGVYDSKDRRVNEFDRGFHLSGSYGGFDLSTGLEWWKFYDSGMDMTGLVAGASRKADGLHEDSLTFSGGFQHLLSHGGTLFTASVSEKIPLGKNMDIVQHLGVGCLRGVFDKTGCPSNITYTVKFRKGKFHVSARYNAGSYNDDPFKDSFTFGIGFSDDFKF